MDSRHRNAIVALATAGALWGLTVPLSKLALTWLSPAWLTVARFGIAAPALAWIGRRGLRAACDPAIAGAGALGYGAVILLQNAGLARTSVSHAAVIVGVVPILVAFFAAAGARRRTPVAAWAGYALALVGIALIAGRGGAGTSALGDLLVLGSAVLSALSIAVQPRLLAGRDVAAVTAVQFAAAAVIALPFAALGSGAPAAPGAPMPVLAVGALSIAGTLLAFWLFARGQARVPATLAGAFVNLEPLVGAIVGWIAFGDVAGALQLVGGGAVLAGVVLGALPAGAVRRGVRAVAAAAPR